jgi:hypothetical protein
MARKSSTIEKPISKPAIRRKAARAGKPGNLRAKKAPAKSQTVPRARAAPTFGALPQLHSIADDPTRMVKVEWDRNAKRYKGSMIHVEEANAIASVSHPPTITPVPNDPSRVVRCDWDIQANRYRCNIIAATDPNAHV